MLQHALCYKGRLMYEPVHPSQWFVHRQRIRHADIASFGLSETREGAIQLAWESAAAEDDAAQAQAATTKARRETLEQWARENGLYLVRRVTPPVRL